MNSICVIVVTVLLTVQGQTNVTGFGSLEDWQSLAGNEASVQYVKNFLEAVQSNLEKGVTNADEFAQGVMNELGPIPEFIPVPELTAGLKALAELIIQKGEQSYELAKNEIKGLLGKIKNEVKTSVIELLLEIAKEIVALIRKLINL